MRLSHGMKVLGFTVVMGLLAACGKSIDTALLEGTWHLDHMEGSGTAVRGFRIESGRFIPLMDSGRYDCASPYRVSGGSLVVEANLSPSCRLAALDVDIDSLTEDRLILRDGSFRAIYRKNGGGRGPNADGNGYGTSPGHSPGYSPGTYHPSGA